MSDSSVSGVVNMRELVCVCVSLCRHHLQSAATLEKKSNSIKAFEFECKIAESATLNNKCISEKNIEGGKARRGEGLVTP